MQRILLVESDPGQQDRCEEALRSYGYEVIQTDNVTDAVSLLQTTHPEIVIVDPQWPAGDDFLALQEILQEIPDLVIYCPHGIYKEGFRSWLGDDHVVSSADPNALKNAVQKILNSSASSANDDSKDEKPTTGPSWLKITAAMGAMAGIVIGLWIHPEPINRTRGRIGRFVDMFRRSSGDASTSQSSSSVSEESKEKKERHIVAGRPRPAEMRHLRGYLASSQATGDMSSGLALLRRYGRHRKKATGH